MRKSTVNSIFCATHIGLALISPPMTAGFALNFAFATLWALMAIGNSLAEATPNTNQVE